MYIKRRFHIRQCLRRKLAEVFDTETELRRRFLPKSLFLSLLSGHATVMQHRINVDATS